MALHWDPFRKAGCFNTLLDYEWQKTMNGVREFFGTQTVADRDGHPLTAEALFHGLHHSLHLLEEQPDSRDLVLLGILHLGFYLGYLSAKSEVVN